MRRKIFSVLCISIFLASTLFAAGTVLAMSGGSSSNIVALVALSNVRATGGGGGVSAAGGGNNLDLSKLQVGDIIVTAGGEIYGSRLLGGIVHTLIPGKWKHSAIYIGNGKIVEATEYGVIVSPVTKMLEWDEAAIYRVRTTDTVRQKAAQWALTKVGLPYDYIWLTYFGGKQVEGDAYYCSELCWAAYKAAGGPDIDKNPGFHILYGFNVAPIEIAEDGDTFQVAYSS
ncbi:MAG: YiiX/YebB-like N1pC/P60 family cysteine hydrolase [Candidatus Jordarchaeaceae archaeon]